MEGKEMLIVRAPDLFELAMSLLGNYQEPGRPPKRILAEFLVTTPDSLGDSEKVAVVVGYLERTDEEEGTRWVFGGRLVTGEEVEGVFSLDNLLARKSEKERGSLTIYEKLRD